MNIKKKAPIFEGIGLGGKPFWKVDKFSRLCNALVVEVVGTLSGGGAAGATDFVEYVALLQDGSQKIYIEPGLQRKLDSIQNSTDDTLPANFILVPLRRLGIPGSAWGGADIGELQLDVKLKAAGPAGSTFTTIRGWEAFTPLATAQNRGDVFIQQVLQQANPIAGWNQINDLQVKNIVTLSKLLFENNAITEVKVSVGGREVYHRTKDAAAFELAISPIYKRPGTLDFFPVVLDDLGSPADYVPLLENGARRDLKIEYFWDTTVNATAAFNILAEGIESAANPAPASA